MEKIGKVGDPQGLGVCHVGTQGPSPRCRGVARVVALILEAVDPSVDSSGLTRCCRHGVVQLNSFNVEIRNNGMRDHGGNGTQSTQHPDVESSLTDLPFFQLQVESRCRA